MVIDMATSPKARMTSSMSWSSPQLKRGPTPWNDTLRLPREGPKPGGGKMEVLEPGALEALRTEAAREQAAAEAEALDSTQRPKKDRRKRQTQSTHISGSVDATLSTSAKGASTMTMTPLITIAGADGASMVLPRRAEHLDGPEARRRVEMQTKFHKVEVARQHDQKLIRERAEKCKTMREDRFKRLVDAVCDHGGLAMECAENLAAFEQRFQQRRWELYSDWDENVSHPIQKQAFDYVNPADRSLQKSGMKTVGWTLPTDTPKLKLNVTKDPVRRQLLETEYEKAFHEVAEAVLGRSQSSPDILRRSAYFDGRSGPGARALSRPVLEPTEWGQQRLQGTLFGRFAQACEEGPNFTRARRGGTNVFVPDESDMIQVAGTRRSREHGHHDKGILKGNKASQGESSEGKTHEGCSSGAPSQDHFTFQHGKEVTDLEFPLGKKAGEPF
ncbi:unnamed protein product [Effrenium voratum]|uniref:Uncharacterized protein n=1 Tax=Effrenium voratum TaxID=2562239 RepID=A0AA36MJ13_9DINO|nr:unnamed protein product [Effrenium voratum]CAJ1441938.1 unnamed protein product [Effrenium voratum]